MAPEHSLQTNHVLAEVAAILTLGDAAADGGARGPLDLEALKKRTVKQLGDAARKLGIAGASKLSKDKLAERVLAALDVPQTAPAPAADGEPETVTIVDATFPAKFDLGRPAEPRKIPVENIPWGYDQDRVTAMAVDPENMFVYWEVTGRGVDKARAGLGAGGPDAWLNLRVYDVTGLIFDGTNAHSYFDHRIDRADRQWFFHIGKPASAAVVEVGLKSHEGYFVRAARSGRVDFPRREPAPWNEPQWLTVRASSGDVEHAGTGTPAAGAGPGGGPLGSMEERRFGEGAPVPFLPVPLWALHRNHGGAEVTGTIPIEGRWERVDWQEVFGDGWSEAHGSIEWQGPMTVTTWEAGPFTHPVEVEPPNQETWQGRSAVYRTGDVTHIVYGPWQVVIRNIGAQQGRQILSRWEVWRSWIAESGHELRVIGRAGQVTGLMQGASDLVAMGASERRWLGGSEHRLGGGSEEYRLGASELRLRGASERLFMGSSGRMLRGSSERLYGGASEYRARGSSEQNFAGSSDRVGAGASERLGGASEGAYPMTDPKSRRRGG